MLVSLYSCSVYSYLREFRASPPADGVRGTLRDPEARVGGSGNQVQGGPGDGGTGYRGIGVRV